MHPSLLIWCFKIRDTLCRQLRTFVESLKDTNRNDTGYVDYEKLYGVDGVCLANVSNTKDVEGRGAQKQLKRMITFDNGLSLCFCHPSSDGPRSALPLKTMRASTSHATPLTPTFAHSTTPSRPTKLLPHLLVTSTCAWSIGESLLPNEESDTFFGTNAGVTWQMTQRDTHKYEFSDKASILMEVNNEDMDKV